MNKLLTIITINYNNNTGLSKTFDSIRQQTTYDFEYIVVDGGSSDGSLELIKNNADIIDNYISEHDNGIYNAMNKGAHIATGEYITYLNSGDILHDNRVIEDIYKILHTNDPVDIYFGQVLNITEDKTSLFKFDHKLTLLTLHYDVVNHSGAFIKRSLQLKYPYREDLKICSDRQFFIETIIFENCNYKVIDRVITKFDKTGISSSSATSSLMNFENEVIINSLLPPRIIDDYKDTNIMLNNLSKQLSKYYRFSKIIYTLDMFLIKLYSFFRK